MKIGFLSYRSHPFSGGQGIYVRHLSNSLARLGHEVSVISGPPYPELNENVDLIKIPSLDLFSVESRLKSFNLKFLFNPTDLIEWFGIMTGGFPEPYTFGRRVNSFFESSDVEFDVIFDNQSLCYALLNLQKKYPLVTTIHHPITRDHKLELNNAKDWKEKLSINRWHGFLRMQKKVAPKLKHIVCVSSQSKIDVQDEFNVKENRIDVVLNGIDINTFKVRNNSSIVKNRIVTTASADIPLKGLKYLVSALPNIISKQPDAHIVVIGKSPSESSIRNLIANLGLDSKISFHSNLSENEVVEIYSSAEIAVIPSLYEGFGFGAGEAMSCGVPLISTTSGGLKEVIGDAAIKIKAGSSEDIEVSVLDLFSDTKKQLYYAELGRERIEKEFEWDMAAKKYIDVFQKAIEQFNK